tara:strand:- start:40 stop:303 length:264 start_codon:yes stop_codon:yes gene_type:complete
MKLAKIFSLLTVLFAIVLSGCSSKPDNPYQITEENYEQVAERIAKLSVAQCKESVRSITQDLELCSYAVANYYLEQVAKKNDIKMVD